MDEEDYFSLEEEDYYESDDDHQNSYNEEESDLQDMEGEFDAEHVSTGKSTSQVITKESLVAAQKEVLVRVMELLSVKENQARILLMHYQWNVDKLFSVFIDNGKDRLFSNAGLTVFDPSLINSITNQKKKKKKMMNCDICMEDDIPGSNMTRMECGHSFCNDCWKEHFTVRINEGESKRITCMAHKCNAVCDEDVVRKLVSPELAEKFDRFLVESYVEDNRMVKWCPSTPHCGNAIRKLVDDGDDEVICSCGLQFCFSCLCESHSPCSCLMWKLWSKKNEDESETVNWITVNTRLCPKCSKPVHKIAGCNRMTCISKQHFCWLCGGATGNAHTWTYIEGHSCGKYKEDKVRQMERAKRDLDRYTHYYHQYKGHTDSLKLEDKTRASILEKALLNSENKDQSVFKEYSWIMDGASQLFRSRRILANSYAFAFYMFGEELFKDEMSDKAREIKKNLFEDQQEQLQVSVEKLSGVLEERFDGFSYDKVVEMKNHITNLCAKVNHYCTKMYECIENELLGPISTGANHNIATYKPKGVEQPVVFRADCCSTSGTSMSE